MVDSSGPELLDNITIIAPCIYWIFLKLIYSISW